MRNALILKSYWEVKYIVQISMTKKDTLFNIVIKTASEGPGKGLINAVN